MAVAPPGAFVVSVDLRHTGHDRINAIFAQRAVAPRPCPRLKPKRAASAPPGTGPRLGTAPNGGSLATGVMSGVGTSALKPTDPGAVLCLGWGVYDINEVSRLLGRRR